VQVGLLITQRCNAACTHCATSCGPDKTAALSRANVFRIMEEASALAAGRALTFCISGGEPFLDFAHLRNIVAHGRSLGGECTCVTNGYWATTDDKARILLTELRAHGLVRIAVSTSRFHQRFVKLARVQRALRMAVEVGLGAVLKVAATPQERAQVERLQAWAVDTGLAGVEVIALMPYLREGQQLPAGDFALQPGLPAGPCPAPSLTVREDGTAYSCCSPAGFTDSLSLGNAVDEGFEAPFLRFLLNGRQRVLREGGPAAFADAIRRRGLGHLLRERYAGVCDLCAHIASDPTLDAVAAQVATEHEREYLRAASGWTP
jgi:pyruvate-formate lyase-activating enzyme